MASSITMLQNSFKLFCLGKYKDAAEQKILLFSELLRFKQLKEQSDQNQSMVQINENIILCEYCTNRDASPAILAKLDEISEEIKTKPQKNKSGGKGDKKQEDDSILTYNKAVILFLSGKVRQANAMLRTIKETNDGYFQIKSDLLLIETCFILQEYSLAADVYRKLSSEDFVALTFKQTQALKQEDEIPPQNPSYASLLFGSEIQFPDSQPTQLCKEEFLFILAILRFKFSLLHNSKEQKKISTQLDVTYKNYLNSYSEQNYVSFTNELAPYLKLHALTLYKTLRAQKQLVSGESIHKALKILNPSSELNALNNIDFISQKSFLYQGYLFNNIGCVHYKMEKYALAIMYFSKAVQSIRSLKETNNYENMIVTNLRNKLPTIYLNLADALLADKKYAKAIQIYNQLQESCSSNPKFWYNRGVSYIELFHESLPNKNENHEILDDIPPRFTYDKTEEGSTRRIVLASKEVHSDMDEEVQDLQIYKMDQKYEQAYYQQPKVQKDYLSSAIKSFRDAIVLAKKDRLGGQKDEYFQIDNESFQIPACQIYESSLVYLTYSLLSRGDFNQALQLAKESLEQTLSEQNKFILIQYMMECYIQMAKVKDAQSFQASNIIQSFIQKYINSVQSQINTRNIIGIQQTVYQQYSPKAIFYFNLAALHLQNNNTALAQSTLGLLYQACDITITNPNQLIPIPILNLQIWCHLKTDNVPHAIQLIKRRRLLTGPIGKNKISLLNITK